jgi:CRISPR-associated protein Cas1
MRGDDEQQFRRNCIEALTRGESLDFMIDAVKEIAMTTARQAASAASERADNA